MSKAAGRSLTSTGLIGALRVPEYSMFLFGHGFSAIGVWVQRVGLGWLTWELTESATWLGLITFLHLIPILVLGLLGGAFADHLSRLAVISAHQAALAVAASLVGVIWLAGHGDIVILAAFSLIIGVIKGLGHASEKAIIWDLLPRDLLPAAISLYSVTTNVAAFVGPIIAGGLLVWGSAALIFFANAAMACMFLIVLVCLRPKISSKLDEREKPGALGGEILSGLAYAVTHPGIAPILCLHIGFAALHRPFIDLLPGLTSELFGQGAEGFAILTSMVGLGALTGGLWLAWRNIGLGLTNLVLNVCFVLIALLCLFVLAPRFWMGGVISLGIGACLLIRAAATQTLIQLAVDERYRGRTMSLYIVLTNGPAAFGGLLIGMAADGMGFRQALLLAVAMATILAFTIRLRAAQISAALDG